VDGAAASPTARLLFAGDTSWGRLVFDSVVANGDGDPRWALARIVDTLRAPDVTVANLECVFTDSTAEEADKYWLLRAPAAWADALPAAGVDVVSVANNHALDYGKQGFERTLERLAEVGVGAVGVYPGAQGRQPPLVVEAGGTRLGFLAYNRITYETPSRQIQPRPHWFEVDSATADVEAAAASVDLVVVLVHWGLEYQMLARDRQQDAADALVAAGADIVVGHHPHVPQPVEVRGDALVAWSLGNFLFDMERPYEVIRTRRTLLLEVEVGGGEWLGFRLLPVRIDEQHRPALDPTVDVESLVQSPFALAWRASDGLADATVRRTRGDQVEECDEWSTDRPRVTGKYLQWLVPRWRCPGDEEAPRLSIAVTGERSAAVYRRGIWAQPHGPEPLTLSFDDVPLATRLAGFVGITDFELTTGERRPAVRLDVRVDDGDAMTVDKPHEPGWTSLSLPTPGAAGRTGRVEVDVSWESDDRTGFVFDLWVE